MKTLLLAGTIPDAGLDLVCGPARLHGETLVIDGRVFPVNRGTAAMIGAVCATAGFLNGATPECVIGGDIGTRDGSRAVYRHLIKFLPKACAEVICLHYIIPEIGLHNQVLTAVRKMHAKPVLIADAGFMYAAKASGQARFYDLFLPDIGELAFLADEKAAHPAYTRGFLTRLEDDPQELIAKASASGNAARHLCVKGRTDYVCRDGAVLETVDQPLIEELEPIGGTGDTITGMAASLIAFGLPAPDACAVACRANRYAGLLARPTPATQIQAIIEKIPEALAMALGERRAGATQQPFQGVATNAIQNR